MICGLCSETWKVNNVKSCDCCRAVTGLVNCYHLKFVAQDTSRILQMCYGDTNIPLECLCLLCGCSGCLCEKAIKLEKRSCALNLLTVMRGFFLPSSLFLSLWRSFSSFPCFFRWSPCKSHLFTWGKMIIVMDFTPPPPPPQPHSYSPSSSLLCTFCSVH